MKNRFKIMAGLTAFTLSLTMAPFLATNANANELILNQPIIAEPVLVPSNIKRRITPSRPELYVVMYHADWCGPCKVVNPALNTALTKMADPQVEFVLMDMTNPTSQEASAYRALSRNIVGQYNGWHGVTGFAAVIDASTKNTLGCVDMKYSPDDMATHIGYLKQQALVDNPPLNLTCPSYNR